MKQIIVPLVLSAAMAIAAPRRACAGDVGWGVFGGFLGGLVVSEVLDSHHARTSYAHCPPREVVRETVVVHEPYEIEPGHYEYRTRKEWVPGHYVYRRDRCGRRVKTWVPGCYEEVRYKVWVPARRVSHHARGRHRGW